LSIYLDIDTPLAPLEERGGGEGVNPSTQAQGQAHVINHVRTSHMDSQDAQDFPASPWQWHRHSCL